MRSEKTSNGRNCQRRLRPTDITYRADIDGLRALAVLAVLGFHASIRGMGGGFVGVDIFFVISGFLITNIIVRKVEVGSFNILDFYKRRIRRLCPELIVVLLVTLGLGWLFLLPNGYEQLGRHTIAGSLFSTNFLLWNEAGYFDGASAVKPLLHLWSLGVEGQFYLLWPIMLLAIWKLNWHRTYLIVAIALVSLAFNIFFVVDKPTLSFYSPLTRFWEMMIGALLAIGLQRNGLITDIGSKLSIPFPERLRSAFRNAGSFGGLVLITASIYKYNTGRAYPGWYALAPTIGAALVIAVGPTAYLNRKLLSNKIVVFIGLISYPLYLWHWPLLVYVRVYKPDGANLEMVLRFAALGGSFIAAVITYRFLKSRFGNLWLRTGTLALGLLLVMSLGGAVVISEGVSFRMTDFERQIIRDLLEERSAYGIAYRQGSCFLKPNQTKDDFAQMCRANGKPKIFLWGDSFAAHLYPGLKRLLSKPDEQLSQYTASACPPVLDFEIKNINGNKNDHRPHCKNINTRIGLEIRSQRPDVIIMAANWKDYYKMPNFIASLTETIKQMKDEAETIILIGPAIVFLEPQAEYLFPVPWLSGKPNILKELDLNSIPNSLLPALQDVDRVLNEVAKSQGIEYLSPILSLCNNDLCSVILPGNGPPRLFSWDIGHLTREGSFYYARELIKPLLKRSASRYQRN